MSELRTAARPYARAAYAAARQDNVSQWQQMLNALKQLIEDRIVKSMVGDLRYSSQQVAETLRVLLQKESVLSDKQWNFLRLLASNRRLALLPEIVSLFEQYMMEDDQLVRAEVVSAEPLDAAQQEAICSALSARTKRRAEISCTADPTLLGGAIVCLDDLVIDASIQTRFKKFSAALTA